MGKGSVLAKIVQWEIIEVFILSLGQNVQMCANSSIIGDCNIGDNVIIGANSGVKDENVPDNCIVFGYSPNLTIKQKK